MTRVSRRPESLTAASRKPIQGGAVLEVLEGLRLTQGAIQTGPARWEFGLDGVFLPLRAQQDGDWLILSLSTSVSTAPGAACHTEENALLWLLEVNVWLEGGVRLALTPGAEGGICARREILFTDSDFRGRLRAACRGLQSAAMFLGEAGELCSEGSRLRDLDLYEDCGLGGPAASIVPLVQETGWKYSERSDGKVAVDLEVPGAGQRAIVEHGDAGEILVSIELESLARPSISSCRDVRLTGRTGGGVVGGAVRRPPSGGDSEATRPWPRPWPRPRRERSTSSRGARRSTSSSATFGRGAPEGRSPSGSAPFRRKIPINISETEHLAPPPEAASLGAMALFLLISAQYLRGVRPVAVRTMGDRDRDGITHSGSILRLQAPLPPVPTSEDLSTALSACAVGYDLLHQEAELFQDTKVAGAYFELHRQRR